eukprot:759856-Hanusia_phi.AAC.3
MVARQRSPLLAMLLLLCLLLAPSSSLALDEERIQPSPESVSLPSVRIISPQEGEAVLQDELGQVEFRIGSGAGEGGKEEAGATSSSPSGGFALYLDGIFVQSEQLPPSGKVLRGQVPLGRGGSCGEWHFLEAVLVDEDGWKVEGEGSSVWVSFKLACQHGGNDGGMQDEQRKQVFQHVYNSYGWEPELGGTRESRSGPGLTHPCCSVPVVKSRAGSFLSRTNTSRDFIADVIRRYNISSVLDAGCGDMNWQTHVEELKHVEYLGVDIVPELIEENKKKLKGWRNMRFEVLKNFDASGSKFLISHFDEEITSNWPLMTVMMVVGMDMDMDMDMKMEND